MLRDEGRAEASLLGYPPSRISPGLNARPSEYPQGYTVII